MQLEYQITPTLIFNLVRSLNQLDLIQLDVYEAELIHFQSQFQFQFQFQS